MIRNIKTKIRDIALAGIVAGSIIAATACGGSDLKDMSSEGYDWGTFQVATGTEHDRTLIFFVDKRGAYGDLNYNVLEGSYYNTGSEAPEHLRDPAGAMIFAQNEDRRYYDVLNNSRNDVSRIALFDPATGTVNVAFMSRYQTEWWGSSSYRAVSVNNGPVMVRLEGTTNHLGIKTQDVMAVVLPKEGMDYSWLLNPGNDKDTKQLREDNLESIADKLQHNDFTWLFNQDYAKEVRNALTGIAKHLEKTHFQPDDFDILLSTSDRDHFIDFLGVETAPSQGALYDGTVQYTISSTYNGPHNQAIGGDFLGTGSKLWGHEGAPDRHGRAGKSLDTVVLSLGSVDENSEYWQPKAKIIVNHPNWSNQTAYEFYQINPDGSEVQRAVLQRTYHNKSEKDSEGKTIEVKGTNSYLAKGDLQFIADVFVLMGGQQIPLGFDYKSSYMDYSLDLMMIADGITPGEGSVSELNPELVAALNVNADATIGNVIGAGRRVLGVEPPQRFTDLLKKQEAATNAFHDAVRNNPGILTIYGINRN